MYTLHAPAIATLVFTFGAFCFVCCRSGWETFLILCNYLWLGIATQNKSIRINFPLISIHKTSTGRSETWCRDKHDKSVRQAVARRQPTLFWAKNVNYWRQTVERFALGEAVCWGLLKWKCVCLPKENLFAKCSSIFREPTHRVHASQRAFQALSVHVVSFLLCVFLSICDLYCFCFDSDVAFEFTSIIGISFGNWFRCPRSWCVFALGHSTPYFELRSLNSGVGYNVFLIAQNAKGRSNSTIRQVFTLNNPEKQTDTSSLLASTPSLANLKSLLPILLFGCAGAIALTGIVVVFVIRKRASRGSNSTNDVLGDQSTAGSSDRGETPSYALSTQRTLQSSQEVARDLCAESNESMEKNPDIIPQGNLYVCASAFSQLFPFLLLIFITFNGLCISLFTFVIVVCAHAFQCTWRRASLRCSPCQSLLAAHLAISKMNLVLKIVRKELANGKKFAVQFYWLCSIKPLVASKKD